MIEKLFQSSRYLVLVAVLTSAVSSLILYLLSMNVVVHMLLDLLQQVPSSSDEGKMVAVRLLKVLDLLFIAITFQMIAVSLYRIFITPMRIEDSTFLRALNVKSFHDLKVTLLQVSMVILMILFLEQAVEAGGSLETLYFGIAVGLVTFSAVYACRALK
ncbi:MAG: YqhA family protein [Halopseudomonas yangmingensis]